MACQGYIYHFVHLDHFKQKNILSIKMALGKMIIVSIFPGHLYRVAMMHGCR